jgi:hypothetical protein
MKRFCIVAAIMIVARLCVVTAQEQQPALKPSVSPKTTPAPTRLLLEIVENNTLPPAYAVVAGAEEKPKWIWVTRFKRIPGREVSPPPIQAVRLESVYNGETADVRVSVFRGAKGFEQEDPVGIYQVGVGEQKIVSDLDKFGIEPFTLTLLNTVPPLPPPPSFENATRSIEIASVQLENMPGPGYRILLRNLSEKNVSAVRVEVISDGRPGVSSLWQGEQGEALIKPGAVFEKSIPVTRAVKTATGYAPGAPQANTIAIRTVVFDDLSFEGDPQSACMFESFQVGRRLWLKHVVTLLDRELANPIPDHIEAAKQFKEKFLTLKYEGEASEPDKPSSVAPTCAKPGQLANISVENMKLDLLRELDQIITTRPAPPVNFTSWMKDKRDRYNAWLSRF